MVCNFSWLDGLNHPPFFMFSQSKKHIKDRNGWIVQFSCLQSFTISFRIIWWQFRNTHCRLAFPKLRVWCVPAGLCCQERGIKAGFLLPWAIPKSLAERGLPEQCCGLFCSSPSTRQPPLGCDVPWHFMSPGRGVERLVLKGPGEEKPGRHIMLQPSC